MRKAQLQSIRGFTLVELMITVLVVGILATVALPSYKEYIIRSNRAAAQSEMMNIANRQQQFLIADRGYADKAKLEASGYALPGEISSRSGCRDSMVARSTRSLRKILISAPRPPRVCTML